MGNYWIEIVKSYLALWEWDQSLDTFPTLSGYRETVPERAN